MSSASCVTLSEKLRAVRRKLGFTQTGFAERLGIDPTTLRKWEQRRARPNRCSLKIIKKAFVHTAIDGMDENHE